jgi:hypothetical protein
VAIPGIIRFGLRSARQHMVSVIARPYYPFSKFSNESDTVNQLSNVAQITLSSGRQGHRAKPDTMSSSRTPVSTASNSPFPFQPAAKSHSNTHCLIKDPWQSLNKKSVCGGADIRFFGVIPNTLLNASKITVFRSRCQFCSNGI